MLTAAVALGIGMSITACSDDDKNEKEEQREPDSATGISGTMEEDILKNLICQWCDVQKDELTGNWQAKTYEATEGLVIDESQPLVRSIQMDDVEAADNYAIGAFGTLGIDCMNPNGFSFSNTAVGSVSYKHSTETNTLAVIDVDIKQIPGLQQIRLVQILPENASSDPYYTAGDIIKYKNRYYLCTSKHKYGEKAYFVNFTDNNDRKIGTFNWSGFGKDSIYSEDMASFECLSGWIENIFMNDMAYQKVSSMMADRNLAVEANINQMVPYPDTLRVLLAASLFKPARNIYDVPTSSAIGGYEWTYKDGAVYRDGNNRVKEPDEMVVAPFAFLLSNKARYSMGFTWDQWVPYVCCIWFEDFGAFYSVMLDDESQSTLSASHFTWQMKKVGTPSGTEMKNVNFKDKGRYYICNIAAHWRHEPFAYNANVDGNQENPTWMKVLMNFTKNQVDSPRPMNKREASKLPTSWTNRNITSTELTFTDKGKANSSYEPVYVKSQNPNHI